MISRQHHFATLYRRRARDACPGRADNGPRSARCRGRADGRGQVLGSFRRGMDGQAREVTHPH